MSDHDSGNLRAYVHEGDRNQCRVSLWRPTDRPEGILCTVGSVFPVHGPGAGLRAPVHLFKRGHVRINFSSTSIGALLMTGVVALTHATVHKVQTVAEANSLRLSAGDTVLFAGGQTYTDAGLAPRRSSGTAKSPIVFTASGAQRAIIEVSSGSGLQLNSTYAVVSRIHFKGPWDTTMAGAKSPNGVSISGGNNSTLEDCEISGFAAHGISGGVDGLRIVNCHVHDVGWDGINVDGGNDLYIGYCTIHDATGFARPPHAGSGILIGGVTRAVVEYCEAYSNGTKFMSGEGGGPVGIWSWDSDSVVIQYCESHHNQNGNRGVDGGGFDIDGGDQNCIIQYCYSHDNEGPGYLVAHWDASGGTPTDNNTIRYCISQNDGRTWQGCISMWSANAAHLTNTRVYNNVVYTERKPAASRESGIGAGNVFYNNIFITGGWAPFTHGASDHFRFVNNCYWSVDSFFAFNDRDYRSLEEFRTSGQEMHNGEPMGMQVDPELKDAGAAGTIADPANMAALLNAYTLLEGSPCVDAGIDLKARFSIDPGARDFFGGAIPRGDGFDIGVHESETPVITVNRMPPKAMRWQLGAVRYFDLRGRRAPHRLPATGAVVPRGVGGRSAAVSVSFTGLKGQSRE